MAGRVTCDGCERLVDESEAHRIGTRRPCVYCPECKTKWDEFQREEAERRHHPVEEFEAWREAELQILGVHWLKKLPDE